ncbi:hypothetical protein FO519_007818 [Halicephalobus sp. NKZ332]|nr:hypothetical protein FO519_007818 [Halicephalobus sp. NKZ332]
MSTNPHIMILKATEDGKDFEIQVDDRVIQSSAVLRNLVNLSNCEGPVNIPMSSYHLEKAVTFLNHYSGPLGPKDPEFEKNFFSKMTDEELGEFSRAVNYLDVDRFTQAIGDFLINEKLLFMDSKEMGEFLKVQDDFTPEERQQMKNYPLEYFTGTKIDR